VRQFAELRDRVTQLEGRVEQWQTTLNGHTNTLNAIRDDVVDQGKRLANVEAELIDVRSEMRAGFGKLAEGQDLITGLLTRHLDERDEETRAGDADE
jgi:chromosome segregation ATPase